jgi:methylglutaconyl-CoA hydratase
MLHDLDTLPKPLIARVHGAVYGGGIGLISVCDVVAAASTARFALTEVRLGLVPATIAPYVIRRIGEGAARCLFLNGKSIDAGEAKALGLVSIISAEDALDSVIEAEIGEFLKCAPGAIAEAKALCLHLARNPLSDQLSWTAGRLADRLASEEAREGIRSFLARETPPWAGSGGRDKR